MDCSFRSFLIVGLLLVTLVFADNQLEWSIYGTDGSIVNGEKLEDGDASLLDAYLRISQRYDLLNPPQYLQKNLQPHHHGKRCKALEPGTVVKEFLSGKNPHDLNGNPIMIHSVCLSEDSLGNKLGHYFEVLSCATLSGAHYVGVAKIWNPKTKDIPSPFLQGLPHIVANHGPNSGNGSENTLQFVRRHCTCYDGCHERANALWTQNLPLVRQLMQRAIYNHLQHVYPGQPPANIEVPVDDTPGTSKPAQTVPLIPTVAVHYRCGDNFVGHYGFLRFADISRRIRQEKAVLQAVRAATDGQRAPWYLYILAEHRSRKTSGAKKVLAEKCDRVLDALRVHLQQAFPTSSVLLFRGADLYTDVARLALAPVVICSVSTFCLWPAIANPHQRSVHFPRTRLVVGGDTSLDMGFSWMHALVVPGQAQQSVAELLHALDGQ